MLLYPLEFENKIPDIMMELALQGKKHLPRKERENGKKKKEPKNWIIF